MPETLLDVGLRDNILGAAQKVELNTHNLPR